MATGDKKTILVLGSTGQQGGATVTALLEAGTWNVRGFTRDVNSEKARALATRGVEMFEGDLNDPSTMDTALQDAFGVFSVQVEHGPEGDRNERLQGRGVVEASKNAAVSHIVHSSAAGIRRSTTGLGGPKVAVEDSIKNSGINYTFIQPTTFMENFRGTRKSLTQGVFPQGLPPNSHQDYIAVSDIGRTVARAFAEPNMFAGETVELAGDRLTMLETAEVFSKVLDRRVEFMETPRDQVPAYMVGILAFLEEHDGYGVDDPDSIRQRWDIPLITLEEWLGREGWGSAD